MNDKNSRVKTATCVNPQLEGKTVLITGASSGIGAACARHFAAHRARLLLCARRIEHLTKLAEQLHNDFKVPCHVFQLDVSKQDQVEQKLAALPSEWQSIDILINNAGLARGLDKLHEGSVQDWEEMIDTNIKGLLYVTRAIVPGMIKRNSGHIINLGSIAGHQVYPKGSVYCATKYAVNAISQGLKMDLLGTSIRVTSIDPGAVETEFSLTRFHGDSTRANSVYQGMQPLTPDDIADAIVYCASCPAHVNVSEMIILPTAQASVTLFHKE